MFRRRVNPQAAQEEIIVVKRSKRGSISSAKRTASRLRAACVEVLEGRTLLSSAAGPLVAAAASASIGFSKSIVAGTGSTHPTSLQFGPDGKLYVAQENGLINVYTVARSSANSYRITDTQTISAIRSIPNHNDDGTLNPSVTDRLVTGLVVTGTATRPVIYVSSSDPRVGGGATNIQTNLDTNSGIISRLTWNGTSWTKLDLVRGLPRSEENHDTNGLQLDSATNTLYVGQGGNTNMGAPSNNFGFLPEYALSAAVLSVDLTAIGNTTYDLPTLVDDNAAVNANSPFGGDHGLHQAMLVPGGPVQVYSPGYRNPYDVVLTQSGRLYTIDNGSNAGWGDVPIGTGGNATNQVHEPGITDSDSLHLVTSGAYGGHPDPTRANLANTFNTNNPQSPVTVADPQEGTYLAPGPANGALTTFADSTNGITEYTASDFGGAMKGDLLAVSLDNQLFSMKLSADGTSVVQKETLFKNVDAAPLDVTTQGDSGAYPGTIWVADYYTGDIVAFEPNDFAGGSGAPPVTGVNSPNVDEDHDGYSNADEILNGTDPGSSADTPSDYDHDFVSNLLDPDDDNDGRPDTSDPFAVDPYNGKTTNLPVSLNFGKDGVSAGGLLGMGFTGLMTDGHTDYANLYDPTKLTAGGAAGVFTIDQVSAGDALMGTQQNAFQLGVNVNPTSAPFVAHTRIIGPFAGLTPQAGQSMGFYIGTGDQSNFARLVVSGDNGGNVEFMSDVAGVATPGASSAVALTGPDVVDLYLTVNPANSTVQAAWSETTAGVTSAIQTLGTPVAIPQSWLFNPATGLAVGIISTNGGGPTFSATWSQLDVTPINAGALGVSTPSIDLGPVHPGQTVSRPVRLTNLGQPGDPPITISSIDIDSQSAGLFGTSYDSTNPVTLNPGESTTFTVNVMPFDAGAISASMVIDHTGSNSPLAVPIDGSSSSSAYVSISPSQPSLGIDASTWVPKSFVITNNSPDGQKIQKVTIDLDSSLLPDLIFTPTTAGGDNVPKDLTADSDPTIVGLAGHTYSKPLDGGYQAVEIDFTDFGPGKSFTFSVDIDPANIKGGISPGPNQAGGISGLEMTGSQWSFGFDDGSTQAGQIFRTPNTVSGGQNTFEASDIPQPIVQLLGIPSTPVTVPGAQQIVRISGPAGQKVRLMVAEAGLYLAGIPGGGFDLHPYESNRVGKITELSGVTSDVAGVSAVIGADSYVDIPITLTRSDTNAGINHIIAVFVGADGKTGPTSADLVVQYTPPPAVVSFTLIDADTGKPVTGFDPIAAGATLNLSTLPKHVNIRANLASGLAGGVEFGFDGNTTYRFDSGAPYSLFGDDNAGHYLPWTATGGKHTITAAALAAGSPYAPQGTPLTISFTVTNAPVVTPVTVSVKATDASATETGNNTGAFTITRTGSLASPLKVAFTLSGSAANGTAYTKLASPVTIPAGAASVVVYVKPIDIKLAGGSESAVLKLAAGTGYTVSSTSSATVTIADNDLPAVSIKATDASAAEAGNNTGAFTITRTGDLGAALTVTFTITGTATNGVDYTKLATTVTIPAHAASVIVYVRPIDDKIHEGTETVVLKLASSTKYSVTSSAVSATVSIADNDVAAPPPPPKATPFHGAPAAIPSVVQAEDFDNGGEGIAWHDTDSSNTGNSTYRAASVDLERTSDTGGGVDVTHIRAGEWLQYTVNVVTTRTYTLGVRLASAVAGGAFHIEIDGVNKTGSIAIPNTGGWQTWHTITKTGLSLTKGVHVVRLVFEGKAGADLANVNWLQLS